MKRSVEGYLAQKATKVLDRVYGTGESVVSVDAVFALEQTRVTTEEVLAARGTEAGQPAAGVVLRERQTTRESGTEGGREGTATVTSSETDYQTGKRTEQVTSPAGTLKQLNVAVVIKRPLLETELQRVRDMVSASVGLNRARGDVVSIHSMEQLQAEAASRPAGAEQAATSGVPGGDVVATPPSEDSRGSPSGRTIAMVLGGLVALLCVGTLVVRQAQRTPRRSATAALDEAERARMLLTVQQWMTDEPTAPKLRVETR